MSPYVGQEKIDNSLQVLRIPPLTIVKLSERVCSLSKMEETLHHVDANERMFEIMVPVVMFRVLPSVKSVRTCLAER